MKMNPERSPRSPGAWFRLPTAAIVALTTLGLGLAASLAQDDPNAPASKSKAGSSSRSKTHKKAARRGGLGVPAAPKAKEIRRKADDPFARRAADAPGARPGPPPIWPYGIHFQLEAADHALLDASYYVPKPRDDGSAPVVLFVHDRGSQPREFEEPIDDLKGATLAQYFQAQGYAVLIVDLRAVVYNARREPTGKEPRDKIEDLQSVYMFMLDRHNRGDFNLSKFGVLAIGEGANLAANWAASPYAAVSSDFKVADLAALVLVSPTPKFKGAELGRSVRSLAPRLDLFLLAAERDKESFQAVKELQPVVERRRQSKVAFFSTNLHGGKLLRFMPKVPAAVVKFFDSTIRYRTEEWEPRYHLNPVRYFGGQVFAVNRIPGLAADADPNPPVRKPAEPDLKANPRPDAPRKKSRR